MRKLLVLIFLITFSASAATQLPKKPENAPNPWVSGALSTVFPGAGYFYNRDVAGGLAGVGVAVPLLGLHFVRTHNIDEENAYQNVGMVARNAYGFMMYDSFQQALDLNLRPQLLVNHPRHSVFDLITSPLRYTSYRFKRVWIPLAVLGSLSILKVATEGVHADAGRLAIGIPLSILQSLIIGAGEEAEFRGFYQPAFSELSGSRPVGNIAQAALFGFCHTTIPGCASPQLTGLGIRQAAHGTLSNSVVNSGSDAYIFANIFLFGLLQGWIAGDPEAGLPSAIALHAAWDGILFVSNLLVSNETPLYLNLSLNF